MSETLRLLGGGRDIDLYPWLTAKAKGVEALAGIVGFGLPQVENQWFEGAGSGSTWRGSRVGRRVVNLPMKVYAENRTDLTALLSDLSVALDPFIAPVGSRGAARLFFGMADDKEWFLDVVRGGGGEWARKIDSDDRTYFKTTIQLEAGDPFWTRNEPENFEVRVTPSGTPLLPLIARLRVGSAAVSGTREVSNIGDTWAWPTITIKGPATGVTLIGPNGEVLNWTGSLLISDTMKIDMRANTVENQNGVNLYGGLAAAPRFWYIAPGLSSVQVVVNGMTIDSVLNAQWWPRRWAVI